MKILLTGGGTAGSVSPLLAIAQKFKKQKPKTKFLWIGTKGGPEESMVADYDIQFKHIQSGKLRRYFDLRNFFDIFKIKIGFFQSIFIILKFKPEIILSAGSFVSVPVVWAGWILNKNSMIHQQDIRPGLANKLMAPFATKITTSFKESLKHFPRKKTVWTGNPVREEIFNGSKSRAINKFKLEQGLPTLLVMGGGTGSLAINKVIAKSLDKLTKFCQIVHLTGKKDPHDSSLTLPTLPTGRQAGRQVTHDSHRYHTVQFLNVHHMADAYAIADIVVSRCGMGSLTELAALGKPAIFIPLAGTHQEDNAKLILEKKAGVIIWQKDLTLEKFMKIVNNIILEKNKQIALSQNIAKILPINGSEETIKVVNEILKKERI